MCIRWAIFFAALLASTSLWASEEKVDYARDVLPILSDACYHCHGPDEPARKAGLRLDTNDGAHRAKNGVTIFTPDKTGVSEIVRRLASHDPDEKIPPDDGVRKLTPAQIDTLKRWVEQGATWGVHWAFVAPKLPAVPNTSKNPIDAFVVARLQRDGLALSAEADKAALIRRVSFDLTGLPPMPSERQAFVDGNSADA